MKTFAEVLLVAACFVAYAHSFPGEYTVLWLRQTNEKAPAFSSVA